MISLRQKSVLWRAAWARWSSRSVNRRILGAMLTIGSLSLVVKMANLMKEAFVASRFGTGDAMDAYLIALMFPSFGIGMVAGTMNTALLPTFIEVREREGHEAAQRLFSSATVLSATLLTALALAMAAAIPPALPWVATGFSGEKLELTRFLLFMLLPCLVLSGVASTWSAVLNAGERFAVTSTAPVVRPLLIAAGVLALDRRLGIVSLALGTVAGYALEFLVLASSLRSHGFRVLPRWHGMTPALKQVIRQYLPVLLGTFVMISTDLVDQLMAAMLPPGSVSALSYGNKIVGFILALAISAVGTSVLPHFSRMVANQDWAALKRTLKTYSALLFAASLALTALVIACSEALVSLLFQRGAFSAESASEVARIQAVFALQIPAYILSVLVVRVIMSLKATRYLLWCGILNFAVNIVFNYVFMRWMGVAGIALSTALVYVVNLAFLTVVLFRLLRRKTMT